MMSKESDMTSVDRVKLEPKALEAARSEASSLLVQPDFADAIVAAYLSALAPVEAEPVKLALSTIGEGQPVKAPGRFIKGRIASVVQDGRVYVDYPAGGGAYWPVEQLQPWAGYRDALGRAVREAWIKWANTQPTPKPSWLVPYDQLHEADKEADRQIGEAIALYTHPNPSREYWENWASFMEAFERVAGEGRDEMKHELRVARARVAEIEATVANPSPTIAENAPVGPSAAGEGWVQVPREPTEAMLEAGRKFAADPRPGEWPEFLASLYRAMLAASPTPPPTGEREAALEEDKP